MGTGRKDETKAKKEWPSWENTSPGYPGFPFFGSSNVYFTFFPPLVLALLML
jgi:hypothetical protein